MAAAFFVCIAMVAPASALVFCLRTAQHCRCVVFIPCRISTACPQRESQRISPLSSVFFGVHCVRFLSHNLPVFMRSFFTSANISLMLCAIAIPIAGVLAQFVHSIARTASGTPDGYIHQSITVFGFSLQSADMILSLFFAVFVLCVAGMVFSMIGLRKKDQHRKSVAGAVGNTAVLLFTFLWILYTAL